MCRYISFFHHPQTHDVLVSDLNSHGNTERDLKLDPDGPYREGHYLPDGEIECRLADEDIKAGCTTADCEAAIRAKWPTFNDFEEWADSIVNNEDTICEREYNQFLESWDDWGADDFRKAIARALGADDDADLETALDDVPDNDLRKLYMDNADNPYYSDGGGCYIPDIEQAAASVTLDDVLPDYGAALEREVLSKSLLTGTPDLFGDDMRWYWNNEPLELDTARELLA